MRKSERLFVYLLFLGREPSPTFSPRTSITGDTGHFPMYPWFIESLYDHVGGNPSEGRFSLTSGNKKEEIGLSIRRDVRWISTLFPGPMFPLASEPSWWSLCRIKVSLPLKSSIPKIRPSKVPCFLSDFSYSFRPYPPPSPSFFPL